MADNMFEMPDVMEDSGADEISLAEQMARENMYEKTYDFEEGDLIRKIMDEVYSHEGWDVRLNGKSVVDEGCPHLCVNIPMPVYIRVRTDETVYTDERMQKEKENDEYMDKYGKKYCTVSSIQEFLDIAEQMQRKGM